jgi:hypothetical protein
MKLGHGLGKALKKKFSTLLLNSNLTPGKGGGLGLRKRAGALKKNL